MGVPFADSASVVAGAREKIFSRRQVIFAEGDPMQQILMVISGCVKLTQFGPDGGEVILRLAGAGEVIGALGPCSSAGHCATAKATELSTVLVWDKVNFESSLERFPVLRRNMMHVLESRLEEMDQRFREISTQKVALRLSSQLIRLQSQVGKRTDGHVEISLSRAELAQLTGTTLFTVSRLLSRWKQQGIIQVRRESVLVRDLPALIELSQRDTDHDLDFPATHASA